MALELTVQPEQAPPEARQHLPEIIKRYAAGESAQDLAAEHEVDRRTIYRWMLAGTGDKQYHDLVTYCLVRRVADADEKLEKASDPCHIARAREMAKFARMDLERRRPKLYGAKPEQESMSIHVVIQNIGT